MNAPENAAFERNQADSSNQHRPRRPVCTEQVVAKNCESRSHRRPGAQKAGEVGRFRAAAPEACPRMNDEPVQRNGQMQKENERSEPAGRLHARILLERATAANEVSNTMVIGSQNEVPSVVKGEK